MKDKINTRNENKILNTFSFCKCFLHGTKAFLILFQANNNTLAVIKYTQWLGKETECSNNLAHKTGRLIWYELVHTMNKSHMQRKGGIFLRSNVVLTIK